MLMLFVVLLHTPHVLSGLYMPFALSNLNRAYMRPIKLTANQNAALDCIVTSVATPVAIVKNPHSPCQYSVVSCWA